MRLTTSCEETTLPLLLLRMVMGSHGNWEISVTKMKYNLLSILKYTDNKDWNSNSKDIIIINIEIFQ